MASRKEQAWVGIQNKGWAPSPSNILYGRRNDHRAEQTALLQTLTISTSKNLSLQQTYPKPRTHMASLGSRCYSKHSWASSACAVQLFITSSIGWPVIWQKGNKRLERSLFEKLDCLEISYDGPRLESLQSKNCDRRIYSDFWGQQARLCIANSRLARAT